MQRRDGASGTVAGNVTNAQPGWFVDAAGGDLHLAASATPAIDGAQPHPLVSSDYDQATRPTGALPDVGADELAASLGPPESPSDLRVR